MELALEWLQSERAVMDEAHVAKGWFLTYPNGTVLDKKQVQRIGLRSLSVVLLASWCSTQQHTPIGFYQLI